MVLIKLLQISPSELNAVIYMNKLSYSLISMVPPTLPPNLLFFIIVGGCALMSLVAISAGGKYS